MYMTVTARLWKDTSGSGTHVGSQLGSKIMSSASRDRSSLGSGSSLWWRPGSSRGWRAVPFHDDDISGEEFERRTGCRDLLCTFTTALCIGAGITWPDFGVLRVSSRITMLTQCNKSK